MAKLKVGQPAPDYALKSLAGEAVALSSTWREGRHALLLFLRHLA